ncbi:hypothetical protein QQF64_030622 [Cirrhinus molitorella]|uniref:Uncharacterized protein n=1 Tax=Cirrhinus molitorella TaxID=172907 RepID=A0ABR3N450_9TELE
MLPVRGVSHDSLPLARLWLQADKESRVNNLMAVVDKKFTLVYCCSTINKNKRDFPPFPEVSSHPPSADTRCAMSLPDKRRLSNPLPSSEFIASDAVLTNAVPEIAALRTDTKHRSVNHCDCPGFMASVCFQTYLKRSR